MLNKKIVQAYENCGPDEETKQEMLSWVLAHKAYSHRKDKRRTLHRFRHWAAACASALLLLSVSIAGYAAYRFLTAEQTARTMDNTRLAEAFGKAGQDIQVKTVDGYEIAYLGCVSGSDISDDVELSQLTEPEKTYAAVAVARTDGKDITESQEILVTPLFQGLEPWKYNIFTLGQSSARSMILDGVLYWLMETESIEFLSDRTIYIAVVLDDSNLQAFHFNSDTGLITEDPAAAEAFIDSLHQKWEQEEEEIKALPEDYATLKYKDTVWTDEQTDLKITFPFYNKLKGSSYGFYCQVEGSGIASITFSLNSGIFSQCLHKATANLFLIEKGMDKMMSIPFRITPALPVPRPAQAQEAPAPHRSCQAFRLRFVLSYK